MILLDKFQTQSFKDMNILIKAILKFYTTNQFFKVVKYFFDSTRHDRWKSYNLKVKITAEFGKL